ncbi:MAG: AAA family ATPase [Caldilineaceae bacterium]
MREFNTFGPVNPQRHYHVDRVVVKAALREKIEKGRYLTLTAGRQTGKTTLFREIIAELEATGNYFGLLLDFERLAHFDKTDFYGRLGIILEEWRERRSPAAPAVPELHHQGDFVDWLRRASIQLEKRCVIIIDEFDAIVRELMAPILLEFRSMYLQRDEPNARIVHSIVLVGVRTIPSLLGGTQSPFNIADQFVVPYFTAEEVADLLGQHTTETGQPFESAVIAGIVQETEGQPFLVNRLGQLLTEDLVLDRTQSIMPAHLDLALVRLVNENNTHFASIRSKAALHRTEVLTALFNPARYYDFQDEVTQDLIMYGIFRVLRDEQGIDYARIANPIYRKLLVKAFAPSHPLIRQATNGGRSKSLFG